jgi:hypothetical protein
LGLGGTGGLKFGGLSWGERVPGKIAFIVPGRISGVMEKLEDALDLGVDNRYARTEER